MARSKDVLRKLGVQPSKMRGQNFLIDPWALDQIVSFGNPKSGENLVEIGPGLGALTKELLRYGKVTAIEIEERFAEKLRLEHPELTVVQADVREIDFSSLGDELTVFGNLPYSLSSDILFHLVAHAASIKRAVLMLQKEFVERVAASPGGKEYGALTVNAQLFADVKMGPLIPGQCFHPPTAVESRVMELTFLKGPRFQVDDLLWFKRVVSAAFFKRRKKILNGLKAAVLAPVDQMILCLKEAGIDSESRAEDISIEQFVRLSNLILAHRE